MTANEEEVEPAQAGPALTQPPSVGLEARRTQPLAARGARFLDDHGGWLLLVAAVVLVVLASSDEDDAVAAIFASGSIALFLAAAFYGRIRGPLGVGGFSAGHIDSARVLEEAAESAAAHELGPDAVPELVRAAASGTQTWSDNLRLVTPSQHAALDQARERIDARAERLAWERRAREAVHRWLAARGYQLVSEGALGLRARSPEGEVLIGFADPSSLPQALHRLSLEQRMIGDAGIRAMVFLRYPVEPSRARRLAAEHNVLTEFFVVEDGDIQPLT